MAIASCFMGKKHSTHLLDLKDTQCVLVSYTEYKDKLLFVPTKTPQSTFKVSIWLKKKVHV